MPRGESKIMAVPTAKRKARGPIKWFVNDLTGQRGRVTVIGKNEKYAALAAIAALGFELKEIE